jgi:hypothetical protein
MLSSDMPRRLPPGCIEDVDKKYNVIRVYFRPKKGVKKIRIRGTPWTPEFMEAYEAAKGGVEKQKRVGVKPGTWGYLCARYIAESADYKRLDPKTRHVRKLILDSMRQEPIAPGSDRTFNDFPLSKMSADDIEVLRDRKIELPEAANGRVKAARQVCKFGTKKKYLKSNIARDVEYFRSGSTGFHTWTLEEVQQFEACRNESAACSCAPMLHRATPVRCYPLRTPARSQWAVDIYSAQRTKQEAKAANPAGVAGAPRSHRRFAMR